MGVEKLCSVFKVLGDETRCKIFCKIYSGEMNVGEIAAKVGVSQSLVSHHLHDLRMVGLVKQRREGVRIYYAVDKNTVKTIIKALEEGKGSV